MFSFRSFNPVNIFIERCKAVSKAYVWSDVMGVKIKYASETQFCPVIQNLCWDIVTIQLDILIAVKRKKF